MHLFFHFLCEFLRDSFNQMSALFYLISFLSQKIQRVYVFRWKVGKLLCGRSNTISCHRYWIKGYCNKRIVDEWMPKAFQASEKTAKTSWCWLALLEKKLCFHSLVACFWIDKGCLVTAFTTINTRLSKIAKMSFKISSKIF